MFTLKILCLGNNDEDTDQRTSTLATASGTQNHGLITDKNFQPTQVGYYHTSIVDLPFGDIVKLAPKFDQIILLDQPAESWSHWKPLLSTYKVMKELDSLGLNTVYQDNENIQLYKKFDNFVKENKSFCIYPWIEKIAIGGKYHVCHRSTEVVTTEQQLVDWRTDPEFKKVRQKMLNGERLPKHCKVCYDYEDRGIESYRQFETKEWISKLNINSLEDLENLRHPHYYEVRLSNKCNIMCRGCKPEFSHLIEKEFKKHNIISLENQTYDYTDISIIDLENLDKNTRVYLTGGEPTVISEVYEFLEKCIGLGKTDFDLTMCTNGVKFSKRFLDLTDHFSNLNFSFSLDGYGKVNDYWRHGSDWNTIVANMKTIQDKGHSVSINTVPGIYNVTNLHLLFEFLDQEFPHTSVYLQINYNPAQSAYNHPRADLVVDSMRRCQQTSMYYSDGKSNRTCIDSLLEHYSAKPEFKINDLKKFFEYNDRLDLIRNVKLADYIPELEACRQYVSAH